MGEQKEKSLRESQKQSKPRQKAEHTGDTETRGNPT